MQTEQFQIRFGGSTGQAGTGRTATQRLSSRHEAAHPWGDGNPGLAQQVRAV